MREETLQALSAARMAPADITQGPASLAQFRHVALAEELVVAGVFVRLYNEQPDCPLADAPALCKGLVTHVHMATTGDAMRTTAAAAAGAVFLHHICCSWRCLTCRNLILALLVEEALPQCQTMNIMLREAKSNIGCIFGSSFASRTGLYLS